MTKTNKKGFTLVELIIVIAILAILVAALAPALIKYIEKSRVSKDKNSLDNVYTAIKTAMGTEECAQYNTDGAWVTLKSLADYAAAEGATPDAPTVALKTELFGTSNNGSLNSSYATVPCTVFQSKNAKDNAVFYCVDAQGRVSVAIGPKTGALNTDTICPDIEVIGEASIAVPAAQQQGNG